MLDQPLDQLEPVAASAEITEAAALCRRCHVDEDVLEYMVRLCEAARDPDKVRLGPSSRALLALMRACQALAAVRGREYVVPDDVKHLAVPVLAHRILLRGSHQQNGAEVFVRELLERIPVPTENRK
jgi:MoxR-like ATPase